MDEGYCICFGFTWRAGGPVRVIHLHWPWRTIVSCDRAARAAQLADGAE
jgi:hypothetical protein